MSLVSALNQPLTRLIVLLESLQSPLLLLFRLWVANVFFKSGLHKINDWEQTLLLFEYEYNVPLLPFELAAYLATFGELLLPVILVLGIGTRLGAIALSVLNIVAVVAYYATLAKVGQVTPHIFWGAMLLTNIIFGPGFFSLDHWLKTRVRSEPE